MRTAPPSLALRATLALALCAALAPAAAHAFCGFFVSGADAELHNNASQVVLLRKGNRTVLTMSNNYKGPPQDFAMVVPVPVVLQKDQVKTLKPDVFKHIDQLSAPRLVEYWEQDPCYVPPPPRKYYRMAPGAVMMESAAARDDGAARLGVTIEAKFEVGEYQILILSAKESGGLETWLRQSKYNIPKGAAAALAPYIRDQMKFFVAKVDIKKVNRDGNGGVQLSPLRFHYDAQELRLPVRLGLLNANGKQDLIVYLLHPERRFEVANYQNLFIPTNIEVSDKVRTYFGSFYAELFDETLRRNGNRGVVTEYAWRSTSCDPCPTPPLTDTDVFLLGGDVLGQSGPSAAQDQGPQARSAPFFGAGSSWVLTRMHTRYDQQTLTEDLIFREAKPVFGGRANGDGTIGDGGAQIQESGENNFQGRYIIRHYWAGAVQCKEPRYGVWGGPPSQGYSRSGGGNPQPAQDLAEAPRGKLALADVVETPVPSLKLAGKRRPLRPGERAR